MIRKDFGNFKHQLSSNSLKQKNLIFLKEEVAQTGYTSLIFQKSILPELAPSLATSLGGKPKELLFHFLLIANRLLRLHRAGPSASLDEWVNL